jgi:ABC-2 type transport system ATP-binding protein
MSDDAIVTNGLSRCFGKRVAVSGLDLRVPRGSVFGFLGRNGAGKTTTIRMLLRLLAPTAGGVRVLGLDPRQQDQELKQRTGYVAGAPILYKWMKVGELMRFNGSFYQSWDSAHAASLMERFGLDPDQRVGSLSRGMNAQLALVLALGHRPELLILDEPATGLDVLVRRDFLESIVQLIQEEGRTVFFSSHLVHEVERVADRVGIIEEGQLVSCGSVDQVRDRVKKVLVRVTGEGHPETVEGVLGVEGDDDRRLLTMLDMDQARREQLQAAGARVLEVMDLSLEDSFAELVRSRGGVR